MIIIAFYRLRNWGIERINNCPGFYGYYVVEPGLKPTKYSSRTHALIHRPNYLSRTVIL